MTRTRHCVGPYWPPQDGAYDYALTLCQSDFAWEFLRRDPQYQRDYQLNRKGVARQRRLKTGLILTRIRRCASRAVEWGLHSFR